MDIEKAIPCYFYSFSDVVSYKVLSPSKEVVDNPVFITTGPNNTIPVGVMVPYGGYLNFVLASNHTATTKVVGDQSFTLRYSVASDVTEIKVLLPMVTVVTAS